MTITNFDEVIEKLKEHLDDYLTEQGINTAKPFSCLHPEHEDKHPSCGIIPGSNRTKWHCFSHSHRGDIFDAINYLEDKPNSGPDFIQETVIPLAKKYGIDIKEREMAPEELYRVETFSAYKKAADYIAEHATPAAITEMKRRNWKPETCSERNIGSIDSIKNFINALTACGYSRKFLDDIDLTRESLFNEHNLIFTVSDDRGRPCGFAAKNLRYNPNDRSSFKYINSRNSDTDVKCNIYDKGKRLYNIHFAKKVPGPIYIFEGYGDVETAVQNNIENVVCIGGVAFTEYHILELRKLGKLNIILCLDGDKAGLDKTNKIVKMFSEYKDFRVKVVCIPEEMDPDDFIRAYGPEKFKELKQYTAFEWMLNQYDHNVDPKLISDEMVKIIAAEPSCRLREEMANTLAQRVPYSKNAILTDVEALINEDEAEKEAQRKLILDTLVLNLKQYPADWFLNMKAAEDDLKVIESEFMDDSFSPEAFIKDITDIKIHEESSTSSLKGYNLGDWSLLQDALNGDWNGTLDMIGGSSNSGKTGLMSGLALRLVENNLDKDVMVLFQSIDDTLNQFLSRIICQLAQREYQDITLNMIKNPNGFSGAGRIVKAREKAYEKFTKMAADGRFIVRGGEQRGGNTIKFASDWVRYNREKYPNRKIVYFLDNFHRLRDFTGMKDERTRFKTLSNAIKDIAKENNIAIWATVEYTKAAGIVRPDNTMISESVAMEYDGNFIMHLYNELHAKREDSLRCYDYVDYEGKILQMPTVEGIVGKNKITEFKSSLFWDFYTTQSRFTQVSRNTVEDRERTKKADHKSDKIEVFYNG